jgi:hypothetical protein
VRPHGTGGLMAVVGNAVGGVAPRPRAPTIEGTRGDAAGMEAVVRTAATGRPRAGAVGRTPDDKGVFARTAAAHRIAAAALEPALTGPPTRTDPLCMRVGAMIGIVVGGALGLASACGPKVEKNHRHLAEQMCHDWYEFIGRCSTNPWSEDSKRRGKAECEAQDQWDWTDDCGVRWFEWMECGLTMIPCEERPTYSVTEGSYCYEEARASLNCTARRNRGG